MQAVRVHPAPVSSQPYSPSNPAPPSALHLDQQVPIPEPLKPEDILVRVKATSVIRDALTWPETYHSEYAILGNDFAGVVEKVSSNQTRFTPGDEVFGMAHADRASTWAEFAVVKQDEVALKPPSLTWEQAASLPLSALTAYEALFERGGVDKDVLSDLINGKNTTIQTNTQKKRVLITGAAGGVGVYLVQLAVLAGLEVTAASSSNSRNETFLKHLGAHKTVEYDSFKRIPRPYDLIIDTVGGDVLASCWPLTDDSGTLITVDSMSVGFVEEHKRLGHSAGKEKVKALFFIVSGSRGALGDLAKLADSGLLRPFVADTFRLASARQAYERASVKSGGHGKVILTV